MCVCVCVCACVRACMRACVCVCEVPVGIKLQTSVILLTNNLFVTCIQCTCDVIMLL